ncbi:sensor histidine kinase [Biformimicrobium ophioploci]|uniref:histidine kinase n=1 Tax=Biformimicrobium ophioploci TaxID=3036711 RepID=A0ABQ6LVX2_9GAMM|nr:HAMP domain-containing sensor histidine kinase [Microbulbifer sp. NKW57]GMG86237.1 ATP-binding protein [Microbulbifer sp. NKW57]
MRWQLLRFLGLLILAVSLLLLGIGTLFDEYSEDPGRYSVDAQQLTEILASGETEIVSRMDPETLYFPPELADPLERGEVIGLGGEAGEIFFYRKNGSEVLRIGPFRDRAPVNLEQWQLLMFGGVLLAFLLLVGPMFRDLSRVQKSALQFAKKPIAMTPSVARHSLIFPLADTFRRVGNLVLGYCQLNQDLARTLAHEIRTPLARIKFQLAISEISPDSKAVIKQSVVEVESLVGKYLNFSRMEYGEQFIRRLSTDVEPMFARLADTLEHDAPDLDVRFYYPDGEVWLEPESLLIAIQNLVANARKYAGCRLDIRLEVIKGECRLIVEDDGPGLDSTNADELTRPFYRATTEEQGYGLGLYIVKKVMMWHDGSLELSRSERLGGARATMTWPNCP